VPADAQGAYYSVVFFESYGEKGSFERKDTSKGQIGIHLTARIGTHITLLVGGTIRRQVSDFDLTVAPPKAEKPLVATYTLKNTGNVDIKRGRRFFPYRRQ